MILHGNSKDVLKTFPDNHFDSMVTDPPYGWKFMCKKWDYEIPGVDLGQVYVNAKTRKGAIQW